MTGNTNPFNFCNGKQVSSITDLLNACYDDPGAGIFHLMGRHFEPWLRDLKRGDLAKMAVEARKMAVPAEVALYDHDRYRLDRFLERICFVRWESSGLGCLLHFPPQSVQPPYPVILSLHGVMSRGSDLRKVVRDGLAQKVSLEPDFPFFVVAPQCPAESYWSRQIDALKDLVEDVVRSYPVDPRRIYLTGSSMGGHGAWRLAQNYPEKFAALVPICGGGNPEFAYKLKNVPTWVFHGARDDRVPPEESIKMVQAMQACGYDVRFTLYPDAWHDSWTQTYANPELYSWMLEKRK